MKRYYCPQWSHVRRGWIDVPSLAATQEKPANDSAKSLAETYHVVTRVIRKPHGWAPAGHLDEFPIKSI